MKKLTKISLHNLSQAELAKKEENLLRGGQFSCACAGAACFCDVIYPIGSIEYVNSPVTISTEENVFDKDVTFMNTENGY